MFEIQSLSILLVCLEGIILAFCISRTSKDAREILSYWPCLVLSAIVTWFGSGLLSGIVQSENVFAISSLLLSIASYGLFISEYKIGQIVEFFFRIGVVGVLLLFGIDFIKAAFNYPLHSDLSLPAVVQTWLGLFAIGAATTTVSQSIIRQVKREKLLDRWKGNVAQSFRLPVQELSLYGNRPTAFEESGYEPTYQVTGFDEDFWKTLDSYVNANTDRDFLSPPHPEPEPVPAGAGVELNCGQRSGYVQGQTLQHPDRSDF